MAMTDYSSKLVATGKLGDSTETVKLYVAYKSKQDIANNKSTVYVGMYIVVSGGWNIGRWGDNSGSYVGKTTLTFDGTIPEDTTGTRWLVENKTFTVNHDAEGKASAKIYWKWGVNSSWGNMVTPSGSFTYTLPTIPRVSSITATNANIESATTITISRASSSFTHTLQYKINGQSSYTNIVSKTTATSYKWTIPKAAYDYVGSTAKTVTISINCITYSGSTKIGEAAKTITATCSESKCKPTLAPTVTDIGKISTVLTGDADTVIKYYNNISYTIGATAKNGATIKSQKITCGNKSATAASGTIGYVESNKFTISVTDSRGFSNSTTITKTLVNYVKVTCNLTASAVLDSSTNTATVSLTVSGNWYNGSFGAKTNAITVQYRYKTNSGSYGSWTTLTATKSGNTYKATKSITGLDYGNTYTIEARAYDTVNDNGATNNFGLATSGAKTVSAKPVFDWGKSDFQFNVPVKMPQSVYYDTTNKTGGGLMMNNSDISGCNAIIFGDVSNSGNEGLNYARSDGNWDILKLQNGRMYVIPNFPDNTTAYSLYYTSGDKLTLSGAVGFNGYITSGSTELFFSIPLSKPVVAASSVTISGKILCRGVEGYLYNPATSTSTLDLSNPNGFTITKAVKENSIYLRLTFANKIQDADGGNYTNNTPVASVNTSGDVVFTFS